MATVLAALTTHNHNPLNLGASMMSSYLHGSAMEGSASLGNVQWSPRAKGVSAPGDEKPLSTPPSVGLVDFVTTARKSTKERAKVWETMFLPPDPEAILRQHWTLDERQFQSVLDTIREKGWDAAVSIYEERRRSAKRAWTDATGGETYGKGKAESWVPRGWRAALDAESVESIEKDLADLRANRDAIVEMAAISDSDIERAKQVRDVQIPECQAEIDKVTLACSDVDGRIKEHVELSKANAAERDVLRQQYNELAEILVAKPPFRCPSCNLPIKILPDKTAAVKWEAPDVPPDAERKLADISQKGRDLKAEDDTRQKQIQDLEASRGNLSRQKSLLQGNLEALNRQAADAYKQASEIPDQSVKHGLEQHIASKSDDLHAKKSKMEADRQLEEIAYADHVCQLLGPTGARNKMLQSAISSINGLIAKECETAGWLPIRIVADDYSMSSGDIAVQAAAKNEQMKAQWLCQIACAINTESVFVVLDGTDIVKGGDWHGFVEMVNDVAMQNPDKYFVVCATMTDPDEIPHEWAQGALRLWS